MKFKVTDSAFNNEPDTWTTVELPSNLDMSNEEFESILKLDVGGLIVLDTECSDKIIVERIE